MSSTSGSSTLGVGIVAAPGSGGYIYCFSNPSMPDILKIGMTERTPEIRLNEANTSDTWRPPTPYKIEFAKKVIHAPEKEKTLHVLLEQYTERINPRREFFRVSPEEVRKFFDLMDGEMWIDTNTIEEPDEQDSEDEDASETPTRVRSSDVIGCRDMTKCFTNGQRIRHTIGINRIWIGTYDSLKNAIIHDGNPYTSLSSFALYHIRTVSNPTRMSINGWSNCECEVDGKWISTNALPG